MSEEKKDPISRLKWFSDMVENVPKPKGDSTTDRIVDIESARLVRRAGEVAMDSMGGGQKGSSIEKGVARGLEASAAETITKKLVGGDPVMDKVYGAIGDFIASAVKDKLGGSSGQSDAEKELAAIRHKEELAELFGQIKEELILPLHEEIQTVAKKVEESPKGTGGALTTEDAVEMVMNAQAKAKELLQKQGFSVESVNVTKEDVTKMLDEERAAQAEREAKLKEEWEEKSGAQVQIESERIKATENILSGVADKVFDMFLSPLKDKIQEAIDRGAFRGQPAG
jgi:hypothetical protein